MPDNPNEIATYLVRQHGLEEADRIATTKGLQAQKEGRFYDLSVWREVKRIIRNERARPSPSDD